MIAVGTEEQPLDRYARETLQRLPLADATLSLWSYVLQPTFLGQVFAEYRGRSYEETLSFARFVDLIGDALVEHQGSGRQSFTRAQERGTLETSSEAVYGKLRRVPLSLSLGFFTEGTARLRALLPAQHLAAELPASIADLTVVVGDGKTLKRVAAATAGAGCGGQGVWRKVVGRISAQARHRRGDGRRSGWGAQ
jgi:hypothetical protein